MVFGFRLKTLRVCSFTWGMSDSNRIGASYRNGADVCDCDGGVGDILMSLFRKGWIWPAA